MLIEPFRDGHAVALLNNGSLDNLLIDIPKVREEYLMGATFFAEVERVIKSLGGCFLKLPNGKKGYLRETKGLHEGQWLIVQANNYTPPDQALVVSRKITHKGRYVIITPGVLGVNVSREITDDYRRDELVNLIKSSNLDFLNEAGVIIRSASHNATQEDVLSDLAVKFEEFSRVSNVNRTTGGIILSAPSAREIGLRDWEYSNETSVIEEQACFDQFGLWEQILELQTPHVKLNAHAWMSVEPTQGMVVIDINTGGNLGARAHLDANLSACVALPRQLRLRGLGGKIVIEFAPLNKNLRNQVEKKIRLEFKQDKTSVKLAGWTPLGNYELEKSRDRFPLANVKL